MSKPTMEERIAAAVAAALAKQQHNAAISATLQMVESPQVASLATDATLPAIPDEMWEPLRSAYVRSQDNPSRDNTFRNAALKFGASVVEKFPAYRGKPIPDTQAARQADIAAASLRASYGTEAEIAAKPESEQKAIKLAVTQKRSRALALFTCATLAQDAYAQGFKGGVVELGKLCTELKDHKYDLAATLAARQAEAQKPKDYNAFTAQVLAGILNAKGDQPCVSAHAKAQLVQWADTWGLKVKHADECRNPALAAQPRKV